MRAQRGLVGVLAALAGLPLSLAAQPRLHHAHLNSTDPDAAIDWYLRVWPSARRTVVDGHPALAAEMMLVFDEVESPPPGAWSDRLHRSDPQSAFWHIGAYANTTDMDASLGALGIAHLPLFTGPDDRTGVWRSGLSPYDGTRTAAQLADAPAAAPRPGGFSYVVAPDGALFEFTGGPTTTPSFSHIHLFHENPVCAANWYATMLGFELPPTRATDGETIPGVPVEPCEEANGEPGWPSLEPGGTIRSPRAAVRYDGGSLSWYPRQCAGRCDGDSRHAPSRGQVLDHVAFEIDDFDGTLARLRAAGTTILQEPYRFDGARAVLIEDPDRLAVELIERAPGGGDP